MEGGGGAFVPELGEESLLNFLVSFTLSPIAV